MLSAEELGDMWGTAIEESKYYKIVNIPIPDKTIIEAGRSEEHTSELQSRLHLVCRLLLEKKKKNEKRKKEEEEE